VVENDRGERFQGRGGIDLDKGQTARFDPLAVSLLDERTRSALLELGLVAEEEEPEACVICVGIALCCLKITIWGECHEDSGCGGGGSIGFDCTCL